MMAKLSLTNEIDDRIAMLQADIEKLEKKKRSLFDLSDEQRLSILLHSTVCQWNHTDGCPWHYEINDDGSHQWDKTAHTQYLKKAKKLIEYAKEKDMDVVDLLGIYQIFKEL